MPEPTYLTPEGLEKVKEELERLKTVTRPEVTQRIQESRERGGTVENAEFEEAKNDLAFVEGRIQEVEALLASAVIIREHQGGWDRVGVGATVTVRNPQGQTRQYTITGSAEADPARGKISNVSPIGRALLGKKVGEVAEFEAPSGKIRLEVLAIE